MLLEEMVQALHDSMKAAERVEAPEEDVLPATKANDRFMAGMRKQALEQRNKDIADGVLVSAADLAERLQLSKQAVSAAVRADRMFVLSGPSGEGYLPAFFANPMYHRPSLEMVSKALGSLPGASKWQFFTTPRISLGKKNPLALLEKGQIDPVLEAVATFLDE